MKAPIQLQVSHHYAAPPERVFDAWLDPDGIGRWLFATPAGEMKRVELEARVGGRFVVEEQRGDTLARHLGQYLTIERPRRLVFSFTTDPDEPPSRVTVEITPTDGGCALTLTHEMDPIWSEYTERTRDGWTQILTGLDRALDEDDEGIIHDTINLERTYDAPPARVFAAWADPKARARWSVPDGAALVYDAADFREGGLDRARCGSPDDMRYVIETRYVSIAPQRHIVFAEQVTAAGRPQSASVVTVALQGAAGGRTHLALTIQLTAVDPTIHEGNHEGWAIVLDQLAGWLRGERGG